MMNVTNVAVANKADRRSYCVRPTVTGITAEPNRIFIVVQTNFYSCTIMSSFLFSFIYIFIHQTHGSNNNKENKNEYYKGLQTHTHTKMQLH